MNETSLARLSQVHPRLSALVQQLATQLAAESIDLHITQGLRSYADQAALYAKGRTAPGSVVTNAPPGHSWHEFGLAVDVAPFDQQGKPDWNVQHPAWKRIVELGIALGLFSGTQFHSIVDTPHFQLTGNFPASPTEEVRQLYASGGLRAVWQAAFAPPPPDVDSSIAVG